MTIAPARPDSPPRASVPTCITWSFWLIVLGTAVAVLSNLLELGDQLAADDNPVAIISDLVLTVGFVVMFIFFGEMMRQGRRWGRPVVVIGAAVGLLFNVLGLLGIGGRPINGATQVSLAVVSMVASVVAVALMFLPPARAYFALVGEQRREVSRRTRRALLVAHVAISVGWLGMVTAMGAMAIAAAASRDPEVQFAVYTMMALLDDLFLGMTSLCALFTGVVGGLGTKWGLMQRYWVSTKFILTISLMVFGFAVIHGFIQQAKDIVTAGAPGVHGVSPSLAMPTAIASMVAFATLAFMTTISVLKPWGWTRYGKRRSEELRSAARRRGAGEKELVPER